MLASVGGIGEVADLGASSQSAFVGRTAAVERTAADFSRGVGDGPDVAFGHGEKGGGWGSVEVLVHEGGGGLGDGRAQIPVDDVGVDLDLEGLGLAEVV